jgi:hypothetical protein
MIYWITIAILTLVTLIFFSLYWKGVKARNYLRSFLIQILLDEEAYEHQKKGLKDLVLKMQVKDAMELAHRVRDIVKCWVWH